jgi:hypothetical protein
MDAESMYKESIIPQAFTILICQIHFCFYISLIKSPEKQHIVKKTLVRFCSIAMIGLALTACGDRHHHDHDNDNSGMDTTAAAKPAENHEEHHEHSTKHEEHTETTKDTVVTEKGVPVVVKTDVEKTKDESTMNSSTEKKHVKPGGVQGTKQ